jgi:Na+-driven multidrug efflux pump
VVRIQSFSVPFLCEKSDCVSFPIVVTATLVSKQHALGDKKGTQDAICQALFVGFFIALIGTPIMFFNPDWALGAVLKGV